MNSREFLKHYIPGYGEVKDASENLDFVIPERNTEQYIIIVKGSTIGDGTNCAAARSVKQTPDVEAVWMGAASAYVVFSKPNEILRYQHYGVIPKSQDEGIFPEPGKYTLRVPAKSHKLGLSRTSKNKQGPRPNRGRRLSTAAIFRSK
jgi:hypothetical protein